MNPPSPRAILFDWDNTLIDSWVCIHEAVNATLRTMGHDEWTLAETRSRVAKSLRDSFPVLFGDRWEEARDVYYRAFEAVHLERLAPMLDAEAMLAELKGRGLWLGVVSNKNGRFLRSEAAHLGWDRWFDRLVGATDAVRDKPDPAPVLMALEGSGIAPGPDVWFVGDAAVDLECAVNAGCSPVLLRPEAPGAGEFTAYPPCHYFRGCGEFAALVRQLAIPISAI